MYGKTGTKSPSAIAEIVTEGNPLGLPSFALDSVLGTQHSELGDCQSCRRTFQQRFAAFSAGPSAKLSLISPKPPYECDEIEEICQ